MAGLEPIGTRTNKGEKYEPMDVFALACEANFVVAVRHVAYHRHSFLAVNRAVTVYGVVWVTGDGRSGKF